MRRRSGGLLCCGYRPGIIYQCTRRNRPAYPRLAGYVKGIISKTLERSWLIVVAVLLCIVDLHAHIERPRINLKAVLDLHLIRSVALAI